VNAIEGLDVQDARADEHEGEDHVRPELQGVLELEVLCLEQGPPSEEQAEETVRNAGGYAGRDDHVGLEFRLPVEHLCGKQGPGHGGPEDGSDPCPDPCRQHDAAFPVGELQPGRQKGAEPGADLGNRALPSSRTAGGYGQRRGDGLDKGDSAPYVPPPVVIRIDGGICPMTLCFRGEGVDEPPTQQPAQGGHEQQDPTVERLVTERKEMLLPGRRGGAVSGHLVQEHVRAELAQVVERDRSQACNEPDERVVEDPLSGRREAAVLGPKALGVGQPSRFRLAFHVLVLTQEHLHSAFFRVAAYLRIPESRGNRLGVPVFSRA